MHGNEYPHRKDEGCYLFEKNPKIRFPVWWYGKECEEIDCKVCLQLIRYMAGEKECISTSWKVKHNYDGGCKRRKRVYYKVVVHGEIGKKPSEDKEMSQLEKSELSEKDENSFEEVSESDISDLEQSHCGSGFRNRMS